MEEEVEVEAQDATARPSQDRNMTSNEQDLVNRHAMVRGNKLATLIRPCPGLAVRKHLEVDLRAELLPRVARPLSSEQEGKVKQRMIKRLLERRIYLNEFINSTIRDGKAQHGVCSISRVSRYCTCHLRKGIQVCRAKTIVP